MATNEELIALLNLTLGLIDRDRTSAGLWLATQAQASQILASWQPTPEEEPIHTALVDLVGRIPGAIQADLDVLTGAEGVATDLLEHLQGQEPTPDPDPPPPPPPPPPDPPDPPPGPAQRFQVAQTDIWFRQGRFSYKFPVTIMGARLISNTNWAYDIEWDNGDGAASDIEDIPGDDNPRLGLSREEVEF